MVAAWEIRSGEEITMNRLLCLAIGAFLLAVPLKGLAIADCDLKLVGTAWDCKFAYSNPTFDFSPCVDFGHFGLSSDFDMFVSGFVGDEGCTCVATGSEKSPRFDATSSTFECTEVGFPSSFLGKVSSKKLTGQYWDPNGLSGLVSCTKRSMSCP
jgi:hypothetical protein